MSLYIDPQDNPHHDEIERVAFGLWLQANHPEEATNWYTSEHPEAGRDSDYYWYMAEATLHKGYWVYP